MNSEGLIRLLIALVVLIVVVWVLFALLNRADNDPDVIRLLW